MDNTFNHSAHTIRRGAYLISTNIRSFGFILGETDTKPSRVKARYDNFFEAFQFDTDVSRRIFEGLTSTSAKPVFATDTHGHGFLFYCPPRSAGLCAFVKRLDINASEAATIINSELSDDIISFAPSSAKYSGNSYGEIASTLYAIREMFPACQDIRSLARRISTRFGIEPPAIDYDESTVSADYVFCFDALATFLLFIYMAKGQNGSSPIVTLKPTGSASLVCARFEADGDIRDTIISRLDFLRSIMDEQNLNLIYEALDTEIRIAFLPYYIDDGLHGVKAPIETIIK